ncbi:unnamed protein product [Vicia faba]|uniref:Uncharacterized protein n=1 Tax=Vicia faba TaxID=3906 RepID=A0AAV1BBU7_VICFA|nr:unnamed protein product [Vicia faba]
MSLQFCVKDCFLLNHHHFDSVPNSKTAKHSFSTLLPVHPLFNLFHFSLPPSSCHLFTFSFLLIFNSLFSFLTSPFFSFSSPTIHLYFADIFSSPLTFQFRSRSTNITEIMVLDLQNQYV